VIATAISPDFEACLQVGLRGVLAGAIIRLLPLSQRPEDIPPLIEHFLAVYNARHGKRLRLPDDAELAMMCRLPWAGNVQELESAIDCAVQLAGDEHFSISLLPDHIRGEFNRRTAEVTNVPIESTSSFAAEDICGRLVEQIEELTLRILNGGLLPLPTAPLRCERSALEQPILKEILFGTLRACRKYLVQTAQEVKDLGEKATFRRLGLIDLENPFQQALILALQPAIDDILRAPDGAEFGLYLDVTDIQSHPQSSYRRASASHPEVLQAYDRVENLARSHAGIAPTRDQMVQALRDYIGKHVSAGQVSKVRKELGKAKNRAQKRKRMGFEIAEEQASQVRHHDLVAGCSDPTSESDRAMDAEVLRGEFRAMTGAERAREAKRLQVPLPDEESEQIKVLARAKAIYEHLRDQDPEELREMAQKLHIPTDGMKPAQLIQALQRAVVKADCDV